MEHVRLNNLPCQMPFLGSFILVLCFGENQSTVKTFLQWNVFTFLPMYVFSYTLELQCIYSSIIFHSYIRKEKHKLAWDKNENGAKWETKIWNDKCWATIWKSSRKTRKTWWYVTTFQIMFHSSFFHHHFFKKSSFVELFLNNHDFLQQNL